MQRKYGVTNLLTGVSVTVNTKEEAVLLFWRNIVDEAKKMYGNSMYMIIDQDDTGRIHIHNQDNTDLIEYPFTEEQIMTLYNEGTLSIPIPPDESSAPDDIYDALLSMSAPTTLVGISPQFVETLIAQNNQNDSSEN